MTATLDVAAVAASLTVQPNTDLRVSLTAAVGIGAHLESAVAAAEDRVKAARHDVEDAKTALARHRAITAAIRKHIETAEAAPKPSEVGRGPPGVADLSFVVDDELYPDPFIARLFGKSVKTIQRHFGQATKINTRNHRFGKQIKAVARERRYL